MLTPEWSAPLWVDVGQEYLAGETLHGLAKRHAIRGNLVRIWVAKCEAGSFDSDVIAADFVQAQEARIAALERLVGKPALANEFLKGGSRNARPPTSATMSVVSGSAAHPSLRAPRNSPLRRYAAQLPVHRGRHFLAPMNVSYRLRLIDSRHVGDSQEESKQLDGRVMIRRRGPDHDRYHIAPSRRRAGASLQDGVGGNRHVRCWRPFGGISAEGRCHVGWLLR